MRRIRVGLVGLAISVVLPFLVTPGVEASNAPPPGTTVTGGLLTEAQYEALVASQPAPTPAQVAAAKAWLSRHHLQGTVSVQMAAVIGVTPDVQISPEWYGIYMHFTKDDIRNIWDLIWSAGIGAAAGILCASLEWLAVACAIGGAVVAYIVAEAIWYYIGPSVPDCGVHIIYYWWGRWAYGIC